MSSAKERKESMETMNGFHLRSSVLKGALVIATLACLLSIPSMSRATPHAFAAGCVGTCIFEYPIPTAKSVPAGITQGPDGNLWFTESAGNKIGKLTRGFPTNGDITEYPLHMSKSVPYGITTGPDGNLWFTQKAGAIGKITTSGAISEYPVPTASSAPMGIASCFVVGLIFTEHAGNKIAEIATNGSTLEQPIPTANSAPVGVAADSAGCGGVYGFLGWFTESSSNQIGALFVALA